MTLPPAIGFDASFSVGRYRGMGRYARALIEACPTPVVWFAKAGQTDADHALVTSGPAFHPWWEQRVLARLAQSSRVTWLVCPYNTAPTRLPDGIRLLLVVHDLIFMEPLSSIPLSRSTYQNLGRAYRRVVVPAALRRASSILTVSQDSRRELAGRFGVDPARVEVIGNTIAEDWYLPATTDWDANTRGRSASILYVGGDSPHKNLPRALRAFAAFAAARPPSEAWRLDVLGVPVGGPQQHARALANEVGIAERVVLHDYVDAQALRTLYGRARALLFPSLSEGFGIPLLEAMASGCPAVVADRGSLPEVSGGAAITVDPLDVAAMARALAAVAVDPARHVTMARAGLARAMDYHPRRIRASMSDYWIRLLDRPDATARR